MNEVDIEQAAAATEQKASIVDVREPEEFREGHLPGAVNIPTGQLSDRLDEIDRDHPVYVVCASGNRSRAMTDVLSAAGLDAASVAGGTQAWIRAGHPIEK